MQFADKLIEMFPAAAKYAAPLEAAAARYSINTRERVAPWLGNVAHECNGFTRTRENLNYSVRRLMEVWPTRFPTRAAAAAYSMNPEMLGNKVYANRNGNGDEESGDGYRYSGRGLIQLTGRANYAAASYEIFGNDSLAKHPDLAEDPENAALIAAWFWQSRSLNMLADQGDFPGIVRRINGGLAGIDERRKLTQRFMSALS